MKKFVLILLFLFISVISVTASYAQHEYVYYTNAPIKCAWDVVTNAIGYDWELRRLNETTAVILGHNPTVDSTTITFQLPSAGEYVLYCNAWNYKEDGVTKQYSDWATSLTAGMVDDVAQPWVIIIKLKPVGPLKVGPLQFEYEQ